MKIVEISEVESAVKKANCDIRDIPVGNLKTIKSFSGNGGYCNTWANELTSEVAKGTDKGKNLASKLIKSGTEITENYKRAEKAANSLKGTNISVSLGATVWFDSSDGH